MTPLFTPQFIQCLSLSFAISFLFIILVAYIFWFKNYKNSTWLHLLFQIM